MRRSDVVGLMIAVACVACTRSGPRREPVPYAECPGDGLFHERIPLFPGAKLLIQHATTRGRMDNTTFTAQLDAPYEQVLGFYVRCLGTQASIEGTKASFARPVVGEVWVPGDQAPQLMAEPNDMADDIVLRDSGDGRTSLWVSISYPWGTGHGPPASGPAQP